MGNVVKKIVPGAIKQEKAAKAAAAQQTQLAKEAKAEQAVAMKQTEEIQRQSSEEKMSQQSELAERQALRKRVRAGRSSLLTGSALGVQGERSSTLG